MLCLDSVSKYILARKFGLGVIQSVLEVPADMQKAIFGPFDLYIKKIEKALGVTVVLRDGGIKIIGPEAAALSAKQIFATLLELANRGNEITEQQVDYTIAMSYKEKTNVVLNLDDETITRTAMGKPVKAKTEGQMEYIKSIKKNMVVFGVGPAGTGKTYLAMAMAIQAFKENQVSRIILTRPAIEAGEKLGFLPGDLQSKVDPYLRPLYDALYQIMGAESFQHNMEKGVIEVAPLAYMRGRTLDNSYIILDEAQNTTPAQMKMFLTRIGFNSKVVITGDLTQKDLPFSETSGLEAALRILRNVEGIGIVRLTNKDVVRHPLVQKIVEAYEQYEESLKQKKTNKKDESK